MKAEGEGYISKLVWWQVLTLHWLIGKTDQGLENTYNSHYKTKHLGLRI